MKHHRLYNSRQHSWGNILKFLCVKAQRNGGSNTIHCDRSPRRVAQCDCSSSHCNAFSKSQDFFARTRWIFSVKLLFLKRTEWLLHLLLAWCCRKYSCARFVHVCGCIIFILPRKWTVRRDWQEQKRKKLLEPHKRAYVKPSQIRIHSWQQNIDSLFRKYSVTWHYDATPRLLLLWLVVANDKLSGARGRTKYGTTTSVICTTIHLQKVLPKSTKITWQIFSSYIA